MKKSLRSGQRVPGNASAKFGRNAPMPRSSARSFCAVPFRPHRDVRVGASGPQASDPSSSGNGVAPPASTPAHSQHQGDALTGSTSPLLQLLHSLQALTSTGASQQSFALTPAFILHNSGSSGPALGPTQHLSVSSQHGGGEASTKASTPFSKSYGAGAFSSTRIDTPSGTPPTPTPTFSILTLLLDASIAVTRTAESLSAARLSLLMLAHRAQIATTPIARGITHHGSNALSTSKSVVGRAWFTGIWHAGHASLAARSTANLGLHALPPSVLHSVHHARWVVSMASVSAQEGIVEQMVESTKSTGLHYAMLEAQKRRFVSVALPLQATLLALEQRCPTHDTLRFVLRALQPELRLALLLDLHSALHRAQRLVQLHAQADAWAAEWAAQAPQAYDLATHEASPPPSVPSPSPSSSASSAPIAPPDSWILPSNHLEAAQELREMNDAINRRLEAMTPAPSSAGSAGHEQHVEDGDSEEEEEDDDDEGDESTTQLLRRGPEGPRTSGARSDWWARVVVGELECAIVALTSQRADMRDLCRLVWVLEAGLAEAGHKQSGARTR